MPPGRVEIEDDVRRVSGRGGLQGNVGLGIWNSPTSPLLRKPGFVRLARTERSLAGVESVSAAPGFAPMVVTMSWPRKPSMLGTPDQSSLAVMRLMLLQSCCSGPLARLK